MGRVCIEDAVACRSRPPLWRRWPLATSGAGRGAGAPRVSRCLFGPSDRALNLLTAERLLQHLRQDDARTWNFDFDAHTPLPGPYQWQPTPLDAPLHQDASLPQETVPEDAPLKDTSEEVLLEIVSDEASLDTAPLREVDANVPEASQAPALTCLTTAAHAHACPHAPHDTTARPVTHSPSLPGGGACPRGVKRLQSPVAACKVRRKITDYFSEVRKPRSREAPRPAV